MKVKVKVTLSCSTLCDPMIYSPTGSSVCRILQARNTGVGCHFLLQGIFPTQGSNPGLLHCRQTLYPLTRPSKTNTQNDVLFIIGDRNAKVGSQEIPGVTGKFGLGVQNEAGQRLTEFCQENTLVVAHPLQTTQEKTLHMDIRRVGEAYF